MSNTNTMTATSPPLTNGFEDKKQSDIARIKVLVAEGKSTEEIAVDLKTTPNTLRTFCSKNGVSLRVLRALNKTNGGGGVAPTPVFDKTAEKEDGKVFSVQLRIKYKGKSKTMDMDLPIEKVAILFLEAGLKSMSVDDVFARLLSKTLEQWKD